MTTIQIASDLHIEYKNDHVPDPLDFITPSADVLVLAGDIGSFYKIKQLTEFLKRMCSHFQIVLYIPGNHEWYVVPGYDALTWKALEERMWKIGSSIENLHILNRSSVRIGDVCIAGCTLWSKPECVVPRYIVRINGISNKKYEDMHNTDLMYVKKMIDYCQKNRHKLVMITHHPPSIRVLEGAKKKKKFQSLYATDLEDLLDKEKVLTWVSGHVHKNFDFISEKGCRVVGNQKGKPKDRIIDYKKDFVITT